MKFLLNLIAPNECLSCGREGRLCCSDCEDKTPALESSCFLCSSPTVDFQTCKKCTQNTEVQNIYIATEYAGSSKELIRRMKFSNSKDAAAVIAQILYKRFNDQIQAMDYISYVPTATKRIRARGFDQSKVIAKNIATISGKEFKQSLVRIDQSRSVGSSRSQRSNKQRYRLINDFHDKKILLVDDVVTTGATFKRAASYFDKSNDIYGIAFAKTLLK